MTDIPQYASKADVAADWPARCRRSYALDCAAAKSLDDLLSFRRPPKWETDRAQLRRMARLAQLREGS